AQDLRRLWQGFDLDTPLRVLDCPDRQLTRTAQELVVTQRNKHPDTHVTVLMPRRAYGPLGLLLHDRTADKIAKAVSRIPGAAATIVPYEVRSHKPATQ
ncbi:MAG: DNA-binding protein, partial [Mycobacterium sp.]